MAPRTINPIIPGFAPDPSMVLVGGTYYLVNSTFHMFPGIPVYASKDLVNWTHIGNAINRTTQLSLRRSDAVLVPPGPQDEWLVYAGGLYAPSIRHSKGTFYIICTNIINADVPGGETRDNFILSCKNPYEDNWSDPVRYHFDGIDPSIFFDPDSGRAYVQGSKAPGPMTTIHQMEIDLQTGEKITPEKEIWTGTGGIWPEGPHIYKSGPWYYLLISEGACWETHMITAARSKDIWGPYEPYSENPILTARGDTEYIQHTGHSDVVVDDQGRTWAVCLAVRKDANGRYVMGRESFITSGSWKEGDWPRLDRVRPDPEGLPIERKRALETAPGKDFLYIRDVDLDRYHISSEGRSISLVPSNVELTDRFESPTFVGKRQRELDGSASVTMSLGSASWTPTTKAGLVYYKDEYRFVQLYYDASEESVIIKMKNDACHMDTIAKLQVKPTEKLHFRVDYTEKEYCFSYKSTGGDSWTRAGTLDTKKMTTKDFTGPVIGIFAIDESPGSGNGIEFADLLVD